MPRRSDARPKQPEAQAAPDAARAEPVLRPATLDDAEALARGIVDGVRGYPAFAPTDWRPPRVDHELEELRRLLPDPDIWCLVATAGGAVVGQVMLLPARRAARPEDDPGLGHLRNLFVREDHWGTGLAARLDARAREEAGRRGFRELRLFTPAGQARARRFYERQGWAARGEPFHDPAPGLTIVEYRRAVPVPAA